MQTSHKEVSAYEQGPAPQGGQEGASPIDNSPAGPAPVQRDEPKVGRNDPCPCGSGRKYKKCCGVV